MPFLNTFLKTLGLLFGITVFLMLLSAFIFLLPKNNEKFKFVEGNLDSRNVIVEIKLNGPIINNLNKTIFGNIVEYIDPNKVRENLIEINKVNPKVIIFNINSPGGTVSATHSIEALINKFKKENNVKIYIYSYEILASGGYWAATTADQIFANYGAIIGSIGVSGPSWYYYNNPISISNGLLGKTIETKENIEIYNQNAGTSKDLYNPFRRPLTKEIDHLQQLIEEIYNDFLVKVSKSRKIEINILKEKIGALIYTSKQAEENFLIDGVMNYEQFINKIASDNKFDDYKLIEIKSEGNIVNSYFQNYFNLNQKFICQKLNANVVLLMPLFANSC